MNTTDFLDHHETPCLHVVEYYRLRWDAYRAKRARILISRH